MQPRWLGLLALVVAVCIAFVLLGLWQLDVARGQGAQDAAREVAEQPVAPIGEVVAPHTMLDTNSSGRMVSATGTYDPSKSFYVTPRRLGDRTGMWLVTPMRVEQTGAWLAVVRAFVAEPRDVSPVPGRVTVEGMLAPGEGPPDRPVTLPPGQMAKLELSRLVNEWPGDLYSAFVFATKETASDTAGVSAEPSALTRVPPPAPTSSGLALRNLAYALQWWLFAGFALYMWWRMVSDAHATRAGPLEATPRAPRAPAPLPTDAPPSTSTTAAPPIPTGDHR